MIRSSSSADRALELLTEHDRAIVAIADASQATAVALARQSVAAERAAFDHLAARQFWRGVCAERAACADVTSQRYDAVVGQPQVPGDLMAAESLALRAVLDLSAAFAAEADVHRVWAGEG